MAAAPVLSAEGLSAGYSKREILQSVSLEVGPGEVVALLGPNGAGKSTLLLTLAGVLRASSGVIRFGGETITDLPAYRRARAGIATVLQGGSVFSTLTPNEHLHISRRYKNRADPSADSKSAFLLPELWSKRDLPAGLLSGGERQALAITTALAGNPRILLCDEPSTGLAPAGAEELMRRIARVSRERGLPVLWIEQRVSSILPLADRALLMREGAVVAESRDPKEWLDGDLLYRLAFGGGT